MTGHDFHIGDYVRMTGAGDTWFRVEAVGPLITTIPDGSTVLTLSGPGGREFVAGRAAVSEVRHSPYEAAFDYMEEHYPGISEVSISNADEAGPILAARVDFISAEGRREHLTLLVSEAGEIIPKAA
jgi:hypothetical protein